MMFNPLAVVKAVAFGIGGVFFTYVFWEFFLGGGDTGINVFTLLDSMYTLDATAKTVLWMIFIIVSLLLTFGIPAFILFEGREDVS